MATTLISTTIFLFLMIADALGDCVPDAVCKKGFWPSVVTPTFFVGIMVFFTIRLIVNRFRRSDES